MANAPEDNGPALRRRAIVDALVLAFTHSKLTKIVGTDAFRTVLDGEFRTLTRDGVFDLTPVWELLESQPGFEASHAGPPMARFKSWESLLGVPVTLPPALRELSAAKLSELSDQCAVPSQALRQALRGDEKSDGGGGFAAATGERSSAGASNPRMTKAIAPQRPDAGAGGSGNQASGAGFGKPADEGGKRGAAPAANRRPLLIGALVASLAGVGFAGLTLYRSCGGPQWAAFSPGEISAAGVPAAKTKRMGSQVAVTLADDGWLSTSEDDRRAQLTEALRKVQSKGITVLVVRDRSDSVRATAQLVGGDAANIKVTFR